MHRVILSAIDIPYTIQTAEEMLDWLLEAMSENVKQTGNLLAFEGEVNSWCQAWGRIKSQSGKEPDGEAVKEVANDDSAV